MEHEVYMAQALTLARQAMAEGEVPVGCVIVKDGVVVGSGRNRRETARTALGHAEIEAIHQACRTLGGWRLGGCALYVTLEPCPMCAGAIVNARIPALYYGARDDKAGSGSTTIPASTAACWRSSAARCSRNFSRTCGSRRIFNRIVTIRPTFFNNPLLG